MILLFIGGNKDTVNDHALCVAGSGAGGQCEKGILRRRNDAGIIFRTGEGVVNE